ncbi:hypothetical protein BC936DRAFT_137855 [Jimgerdemannia flammicorona]|uniref:SET domain-containing protein n=1 Tax=Jimgerdemannia flammicorona TaxID=994334 RepID=A0A433CWI7_9FUNG|nr:hypothetical protein BC936DRAFT_137855 [Jimgerdemannia flammicorona]
MNDHFTEALQKMMLSQQPRSHRHRLTRKEHLQIHEKGVAGVRKILAAGRFQLSQTFANRAPHSSKASLANLQRITLSQLTQDTVHYGCVLVCRTVVAPVKYTAVQVVVEDPIVNGPRTPKEDVVVDRLSLYNFVDFTGVREDTSEWLPVGTRLLIKEPYYKVASDGVPMIRCDNPGDVVLVPNEEVDRPLLAGLRWADTLPIVYGPIGNRSGESAEGLKRNGNEQFGRKEYVAAIASYTRALEVEPGSAIVLSNRAQAYLKLEQFQQALDDVEAALKIDDGSVKTRLRYAKALYGSRKYEEASVVLQKLVQLDAKITEINELHLKAQGRIAEQHHGQYKMFDIFQEARTTHPPYLDHADHVGPVRITAIPGKGRGIVTTRDVLEGTLILCSKAYAVVFEDELDANLIKISIDHSDKSMTNTPHIVARIAKRIQKEPWTAKELYELHAGPDIPPMEFVDGEVPQIDIERIKNIVRANNFQPDDAFYPQAPSNDKSSATKSRDDFQSGTGLWILPSLLNHSCVPNAIYIIVGDLLFVRAMQNIPKDNEVCVPYLPCTNTYNERVKKLKARSFRCSCQLCVFERAHPSHARETRQRLLKEHERLRDRIRTGDPAMIPPLTNIIAQLRDTYPPLPTTSLLLSPTTLPPHQLRLGLIHPLISLYHLRASSGDFESAVAILRDVFEMQPRCGDLTVNRVDIAMAIARMCDALGEEMEKRRWMRVSENECEIIYGEGEGKRVWREVFSKDVEMMGSD